MRCFTLSQDKATLGIAICSQPYPHIPVGEEGRGRRLFRFPVGKSFAAALSSPRPCSYRGRVSWGPTCPQCGVECEKDDSHYYHPKNRGEIVSYSPVVRASVIKTHEKGTLLLVEERDPEDKRALVLVDIPAGYRGSTTWTAAVKREVPCHNRGRSLYTMDTNPTEDPEVRICPACGAKCVQVAEHWKHEDDGTVTEFLPFESVSGVTVLAEGRKAQGEAGYMGGHTVRLLIMEPGAVFRVKRSGRLYGAPAVRFVMWDGRSLYVGTYDEVFPPVEEVEEGEVV